MLPVLGAVLVGLLITQVAFVVTTVYLHRSLSHRALRLSTPATAAFRVLTWMLTGIRPRWWCIKVLVATGQATRRTRSGQNGKPSSAPAGIAPAGISAPAGTAAPAAGAWPVDVADC